MYLETLSKRPMKSKVLTAIKQNRLKIIMLHPISLRRSMKSGTKYQFLEHHDLRGSFVLVSKDCTPKLNNDRFHSIKTVIKWRQHCN